MNYINIFILVGWDWEDSVWLWNGIKLNLIRGEGLYMVIRRDCSVVENWKLKWTFNLVQFFWNN